MSEARPSLNPPAPGWEGGGEGMSMADAEAGGKKSVWNKSKAEGMGRNG